MIVRIEPNSPTPLYEQIVSAIVTEISSGRLKTGDGLPAARHLAAALEVNMHTVLKAYERLQAAGVIEIRRGRSGAIVIDGSAQDLGPIIENLVMRAKDKGLKRGRLLEMIGDAW